MKIELKKINFSFIQKYKSDIKKYFENLSEENRKKFVGYLYIILTLFAVSFFGFFAIKPTLETISNLQKQYEDNKLILDSLQEKMSALQNLDRQYQTIENDLLFVYSAIPRSSKIAYLTRQIENLALQRNLVITKLDFGTIEIYPNQKISDPIYSFSFNLSVEGEEENINLFLSDLINFDRIIELNRVITGRTQASTFGANINGLVFFSNK